MDLLPVRPNLISLGQFYLSRCFGDYIQLERFQENTIINTIWISITSKYLVLLK